MESLAGSQVLPASRETVLPIIMKYEWLGTMPNVGRAYYVLQTPEGPAGAICFGFGNGTDAANICGNTHKNKAICLERGACVHWAHPHAASFLISQACKQAYKDHGWQIFYAYSDPAAGEIGTVYQACNWLYIGQGPGRGRTHRWGFRDPDGKIWNSRQLRRMGSSLREARERFKWEPVPLYAKHKYVYLIGTKKERKALRQDLRYDIKPYPKR